MKKITWIISLLLFVFIIASCKKDDPNATQYRVTKIKKTVASAPASNQEFTFTYNASGKITRVDLAGSSTANTYYYTFYYSSKLDSITKIRNLDSYYDSKVDVIWTGNNITTFMNNVYTYDGNGRLSSKTYLSSAVYRYDYITDSIRYYYTPPAGTEYHEGSYTTTTTYKNPYYVAGNEKESKVFGFVLNGTAGDVTSIGADHINYGRGYLPNGTLSYIVNYTPDGTNTGGYPNKITITSDILPDIVIEFTYEKI